MTKEVIKRIGRIVVLLSLVCSAVVLAYIKGGLDASKGEMVSAILSHTSLYQRISRTNNVTAVQSYLKDLLICDVLRWHATTHCWLFMNLLPPDIFDEPHFKEQLARAIEIVKDAKVVTIAVDCDGKVELTRPGEIKSRTNTLSNILKSTAVEKW
ncbi:MAG: hypothetical protein WCV00_23750 [Verrucomicrobiia bacterium]|jgi:hypothetical protein